MVALPQKESELLKLLFELYVLQVGLAMRNDEPSKTIVTKQKSNHNYLPLLDSNNVILIGEKLQFSEEQYKKLIEFPNNVKSEVSNESIIKFVSPSIGEFLNHEPGNRIGQNYFDFIPPDNKTFMLDVIKNNRFNEFYGIEYSCINGNRETIWIKFSAIYPFEDGIIVGKPSIPLKISDQKYSEEKLHIREEQSTRKKGNENTFDFQIFTKKREARYMHLNAVPKFDNNNNYLGTYGAVYDVTESKKAESVMRKCEEKFFKALRKIPYVVSNTRVEKGSFFKINDLFTEHIGYTKEANYADSNIRTKSLGRLSSLKAEGWNTEISSQATACA